MTLITSISHLGLVQSRIIGSIAGVFVVLCLLVLQLVHLKKWQRILLYVLLACFVGTFVFMLQVVQRTIRQ